MPRGAVIPSVSPSIFDGTELIVSELVLRLRGVAAGSFAWWSWLVAGACLRGSLLLASVAERLEPGCSFVPSADGAYWRGRYEAVELERAADVSRKTFWDSLDEDERHFRVQVAIDELRRLPDAPSSRGALN